MNSQLGVFAKHWTPGNVKTRLASALGAETAADLYYLFLRCTLWRIEEEYSGRRVLVYSPSEHASAFADLARDSWLLEAQVDGDLGSRMTAYFERAFQSGYTKVVLLGSDSPDLPLGTVKRAFSQLDMSDVVLGPSDDGGYYLIGMRSFMPMLFRDIQWSTANVFSQTMDALRTTPARWCVLPQWYDVDELSDVLRLRRELARPEFDNNAIAKELGQRIGSVVAN